MYDDNISILNSVDDAENKQYKPIGTMNSSFNQGVQPMQQTVANSFAQQKIDPYHANAMAQGHPIDTNLQPRDENGIRRFSQQHVDNLNSGIKDNTGLIASLRNASFSQAPDVSNSQGSGAQQEQGLDAKKAYGAYEDEQSGEGLTSIIGELL